MEQLHQRLACKPASAARARDLLQRLPTPLAPGESATSPWVLSELLTNALRHGCGDPADEIDVHIQETDARVRIEMVQPCPIFEPAEVRGRVPGEGRAGIVFHGCPGGVVGVDGPGRCAWARCPCPAPSASGSRNSSQHGLAYDS
ncbi:MAG TPA: ATP-binding protein [Actinomycetota bacterium]|nr:ATP-binding protein [Actinomycetota bacterium]